MTGSVGEVENKTQSVVSEQELIKIHKEDEGQKKTFYNKYQQNNNHSTFNSWTEHDQRAQFIENN